jgi:hypothetical protein
MAQPLSIAVLKTDFKPGSFNTSSAALNGVDPLPFLAFSGRGNALSFRT